MSDLAFCIMIGVLIVGQLVGTILYIRNGRARALETLMDTTKACEGVFGETSADIQRDDKVINAQLAGGTVVRCVYHARKIVEDARGKSTTLDLIIVERAEGLKYHQPGYDFVNDPEYPQLMIEDAPYHRIHDVILTLLEDAMSPTTYQRLGTTDVDVIGRATSGRPSAYNVSLYGYKYGDGVQFTATFACVPLDGSIRSGSFGCAATKSCAPLHTLYEHIEHLMNKELSI